MWPPSHYGFLIRKKYPTWYLGMKLLHYSHSWTVMHNMPASSGNAQLRRKSVVVNGIFSPEPILIHQRIIYVNTSKQLRLEAMRDIPAAWSWCPFLSHAFLFQPKILHYRCSPSSHTTSERTFHRIFAVPSNADFWSYRMLSFILFFWCRTSSSDPKITNDNLDNISLNIPHSGYFNPKVNAFFEHVNFFDLDIKVTRNSIIWWP